MRPTNPSRLRQRLNALGPAPRAELLHVLMLPTSSEPSPSCKGKHPQVHAHFFTESGQFGSLDKNEQQVDDGTHEIIDGHTFRIGDSTFRYTITGNDTLTLEPVLTREQRREALASPKDFTTGSWMVSVAYEGTTWNRVPCEGWC